MPTINYQLLNPHDTPALVRFIRRVYGDTYPSELFYDADQLATLIGEGRLFSSVGFNESGEIVAHLATLLDNSDEITGDGITGMVLPEYRGQSVLSELARPMFEIYQSRPIAGLHLYAVTLHAISQKKTLKHNAVVTGVLCADWPGDYTASGFEQRKQMTRMPMVTLFFPLFKEAIPERTLYLPVQHQALLRDIYQKLTLPRQMREKKGYPLPATSRDRVLEKPGQGATALRFDRIGEDWPLRVERFVQQFANGPAIYIDIPLTEAGAPVIVEALYQKGWFYGCVLIERNQTDYLRLQHNFRLDNLQNADIVAEARQLLDQVLPLTSQPG